MTLIIEWYLRSMEVLQNLVDLCLHVCAFASDIYCFLLSYASKQKNHHLKCLEWQLNVWAVRVRGCELYCECRDVDALELCYNSCHGDLLLGSQKAKVTPNDVNTHTHTHPRFMYTQWFYAVTIKPPMVPMWPDIFKAVVLTMCRNKSIESVFFSQLKIYRFDGAMTFESPKSPQQTANNKQKTRSSVNINWLV